MITCPKCGAQNVSGLKVCKRCWTVLGEPAGARSGDSVESEARREPDGRTSGQRGPLFGVGYEDARGDRDESRQPEVVERPHQFGMTSAARALERPDQFAGPNSPSSRATASLVMAILAIVLFCMFYLSVPIDLLAIVLGGMEISAIRSGAAPAAGRGYALTGLIIGSMALVLKILILVSFIL